MPASLRGPASERLDDRSHHFFGGLYLEEPSRCLAQANLDNYLQLRKAIETLEKRANEGILLGARAVLGLLLTAHIIPFDKEKAFARFQDAETGVWRLKGIERRPGELVHMYGDIKTAKIAHRLHNPSFTTSKASNGGFADTTNPCTALVMANAYNGNGFLFDHCSRREVVDPFLQYTKDILACHEGYLSQIRNNMHAPVEIVYGIPTWERTQYLLQDKLEALDLWGTYEGITIYLEWENVQENLSETSRRLRRFLISTFHPQNMMRAWSKSYSAGQDRLLEIGYRLPGIGFIERFCETELWRK